MANNLVKRSLWLLISFQIISYTLSDSCSTEKRIVIGNDTTVEKYPYVVKVEHNGRICGGVQVTDLCVLTAANCYPPSTIKGCRSIEEDNFPDLVVTSANHTWNDNPDFSVVVNICACEMADLAILKLKNPLSFTKGKSVEVDYNAIVTNKELTAVGWRSDMTLMDAHIIGLKEDCFSFFSAKKATLCFPSGGPVIMDGRLVGVIPFGSKLDLTEHPMRSTCDQDQLVPKITDISTYGMRIFVEPHVYDFCYE